MRCGSLFSGVGGLDLGLARAGFTHEFFCESDPWRRSVLAHHWPGVPIYEDVHLVGSGMVERDERGDESGCERLEGRHDIDLLSLSARAAQGILRRAEKRGRTLPAHLEEALARVAGTTATRSTGGGALIPVRPRERRAG